MYGSCDGGKTFLCSDSEINQKMLALGDKLNLKRVMVKKSETETIEHAGPLDVGTDSNSASDRCNFSRPSISLEVHKGRDGRFYVVDCARMMPAESAAEYLFSIPLPFEDYPYLPLFLEDICRSLLTAYDPRSFETAVLLPFSVSRR